MEETEEELNPFELGQEIFKAVKEDCIAEYVKDDELQEFWQGFFFGFKGEYT